MSYILTPAQAEALREEIKALEAWVDTKRGKNGWASYKPEEIPTSLRNVSNSERSALECYDFARDKPEEYFCYVRKREGEPWAVITWMGEALSIEGTVSFGHRWRSNMGDERMSVSFKGINGEWYKGFFFAGVGGYARVRRVAKQ